MSRFSDLFSNSDISEAPQPKPTPAPEPAKIEAPAPLKNTSKPSLRRVK